MRSGATRLSWVIGAIVWIALVGCRRYDSPLENHIQPPVTMSLSALSDMVGERTVAIDQPIVVGGYVTSSDEESNFHKTIMIDDGTAAAEVMVGIYDSYRLYPPGYYISIDVQGCGIGRHYGVMQIGLPAEEYSGFATDYFSSKVLLDEHLSLIDQRCDVVATTSTIAALGDIKCGRLVRIEGLTLSSSLYPEVWNINQAGAWQGYNIFQDSEGEAIAVYTSDYADYAARAVPTGEVALTGILQTGKINGQDMFMIKMRYERDCAVVE